MYYTILGVRMRCRLCSDSSISGNLDQVRVAQGCPSLFKGWKSPTFAFSSSRSPDARRVLWRRGVLVLSTAGWRGLDKLFSFFLSTDSLSPPFNSRQKKLIGLFCVWIIIRTALFVTIIINSKWWCFPFNIINSFMHNRTEGV